MDLQSQSHQIELRSLETQHLTIIQDHEARHTDILQEMEEKWKQTVALQVEEKTQEISKLTEELERQTEKFQEIKRNLEHQLHSVQNELRQQEMVISSKHKGTFYHKVWKNEKFTHTEKYFVKSIFGTFRYRRFNRQINSKQTNQSDGRSGQSESCLRNEN